MKKLFTIYFTLGVLTLCNAQETKIKGDRDVLSVTKELPKGITTVEVDNGIEVKLVQGETDNYVLTTDRNLVSVIDFTVKDSILTISTNLKITQSKSLEVYLKLQNPKSLILKDDAKIETPGLIQAENFSITAYKSSHLDVNIKSTECQINLLDNSGGEINVDSEQVTLMMKDRTDLKGDFNITNSVITLQDSAEFTPEGKTENLTLTTEGTSDFKGRRFQGKSFDITLNKRSKASVHASDKLNVFAKDKSTVEVYGSPEINVVALSDKAEIVKK